MGRELRPTAPITTWRMSRSKDMTLSLSKSKDLSSASLVGKSVIKSVQSEGMTEKANSSALTV